MLGGELWRPCPAVNSDDHLCGGTAEHAAHPRKGGGLAARRHVCCAGVVWQGKRARRASSTGHGKELTAPKPDGSLRDLGLQPGRTVRRLEAGGLRRNSGGAGSRWCRRRHETPGACRGVSAQVACGGVIRARGKRRRPNHDGAADRRKDSRLREQIWFLKVDLANAFRTLAYPELWRILHDRIGLAGALAIMMMLMMMTVCGHSRPSCRPSVRMSLRARRHRPRGCRPAAATGFRALGGLVHRLGALAAR